MPCTQLQRPTLRLSLRRRFLRADLRTPLFDLQAGIAHRCCPFLVGDLLLAGTRLRSLKEKSVINYFSPRGAMRGIVLAAATALLWAMHELLTRCLALAKKVRSMQQSIIFLMPTINTTRATLCPVVISELA